MSISEKLSALNFERFQTFKTPLTLANAKQALFAFKGDVYNGFYPNPDIKYRISNTKHMSFRL
jgi:cytoplasmic iron level regulating protein YaaA (DUF328/UPF0246 family)